METSESSPVAPRSTRIFPLPEMAVEFLSPADAIAERPPPRRARLTIHLLVLMVATALAWAALVELEEIAYVRGRLTNAVRTVVVQALETAIIRSIDVREGQRVAQGQLLISLDPTFTAADLAQNRRKETSLASQMRRLDAELNGKLFVAAGPHDNEQVAVHAEREQFRSARLHALAETIARAKAELTTTQRSAVLLLQRMKTLADLEEMQKTLYSQQTGSRLKLLQSQDQRLTVENELSQANNHLDELRHTLAIAMADRDTFEREWRQKITQEQVSIGQELDQVKRTLEKLELRHDQSSLLSPIDGVVLEVAKRSVSSVVREAEQLVTIAPLDTPMEAEIQIDGRDIGLIHSGIPARLKIDTFPYQKYGTVPAVVSVISRDSFSRSATGENSARNGSGEIFFSGRLSLKDSHLANASEENVLMAGMPFTAEIIIGYRSVLSYLVRPLVETIDESLHEP